MIVVNTVYHLENLLDRAREAGSSVGLVPTMGALHRGHLSLIDCCCKGNDITVTSIFVNPDQFNDPSDLERYPRDLEGDLRLLDGTGCNIVFAPPINEIYPEPDQRQFDFGHLDQVMEGHFRPGHFNGVARVVSRLFQVVRPGRAYFGEKDIQQLAVIRRMTEMLRLPVQIIACPTIRESDGLAMSSRNALLSRNHRKNAPLIITTLRKAAGKRGIRIRELKEWVAGEINANPYLELEYFEVVDELTLQPADEMDCVSDGLLGCIAVRAGKVRLIDNVFFSNFAPL